MLHWITFKNELPPRDVSRIRKVTSTLQGGAHAAHPPTTQVSFRAPRVDAAPSAGHTLSAGAKVTTRYFYKTDTHGRRMCSKVYTLHHGGPRQIARDIARHMCSTNASRQRVPQHVQTAVERAVDDGYVTAAHGRKYCDKYARDAAQKSTLIHIREKGKHKVRQYEAVVKMKKHPSKHSIRDMKTKHVSVSYVQTFAC